MFANSGPKSFSSCLTQICGSTLAVFALFLLLHIRSMPQEVLQYMTYLISINKYYFFNIQRKQHIQEQNLVSEKRSKVHENCSNARREKFKIYKSLSISII